jgi:hypothetical protein
MDDIASPHKGRLGETLRRIAITGVIAAGLSLAVVGSAQADSVVVNVPGENGVPSTYPGPSGTKWVLASQPSEHCGYYHWLTSGGVNFGDGYFCTTKASINTYHSWIVCSGSDQQLRGGEASRGQMSGAGCGNLHPTVGGFTRDS